MDVPTRAYSDLPLTLLGLSTSCSPLNAIPSKPSLLLSHLCSAIETKNMHDLPQLYCLSTTSGCIRIVCHQHLLFLSLFPPFSVHSCGLSPQAVMQSSDSCAQSQGLELAHQPSRGVTTQRSVGKQQERKEEKLGGKGGRKIKPMREEKQCEVVRVGGG